MKRQEEKGQQKLHVRGELLFMKSQLFLERETRLYCGCPPVSPLGLTETAQGPYQEAIKRGQQFGESPCLFDFFHWGSSVKKPNFISSNRLWKEFDVILVFWNLAYLQGINKSPLRQVSSRNTPWLSAAEACHQPPLPHLAPSDLSPPCPNASHSQHVWTHRVCWIKSSWLGLGPPSVERNSCLRNIRAILIRHNSALLWPLFSFFLS